MYKVEGGIVFNTPIVKRKFDDVLEAMDFADELYANGFYYATVLDRDNKKEYSVSTRTGYAITSERRKAALSFLEKEAQDIAFKTYEHNVACTRDLDSMFAHMPGYLEESQRAS